MGQVWHAYDQANQHDVAIKIIQTGWATAPDLADRIRRFRREAGVLSRLRHPGIPALYEAQLDHESERPYLAMELILGEDLSQRLSRGPLPVHEVTSIAAQLCDILAHIHEIPIVHRDIKPANIMLTGDGQVVLLDYGVARTFDMAHQNLTRNGQVLGTVNYMAPEQLAPGGLISPRSDLYSLGCVLYELLTGSTPFSGDAIGVMYDHRYTSPGPLLAARQDAPPILESAIRASLAKLPKDRPLSAQAFREHIAPLLPDGNTNSGVAPSAPPSEQTRNNATPAEARLARAHTLLANGAYGEARTEFTALAAEFASLGRAGVEPAAECRARAAHCRMWLGAHEEAMMEFRDLADELSSSREPPDPLMLYVRRHVGILFQALGDVTSAFTELYAVYEIMLAAKADQDDAEVTQVAEALGHVRSELARRPRASGP